MISTVKNSSDKIKALYQQHRAYVPVLAFVSGFIFDLFTLTRIDQPEVILQQLVYIILAAVILIMQLKTPVILEPTKAIHRFYNKFSIPILHFIFGALLSSYTIFYFKSSSLVVSFGFLLLLIGLLVANEMEFFKKQGFGIKSALLSLCIFSYLAYVIPILLGFANAWIFLLSLFCGSLVAGLIYWTGLKVSVDPSVLRFQFIRPSSLVLIVFLILYLAKLIPPVPLSIQYVGVFHTVEKNQEGNYVLGHYKPWWDFWNYGDQNFEAKSNDPIVVFFRIFSPSDFKDQIWMRWYLNERSEWTLQDRIPIQIAGGREEGFRGYGKKSNYSPGEWKVEIVTNDDREIGRIYFDLEKVNEYSHSPQFEVH